MFHAVSKLTVYTQFFLNELLDREHVDLYVSSHDRAVVNKYEDLYQKEVISLEITKPSEQAFKALSKPTQRGGSVLLFAEPVGRQEYENLDFLQRHRLLPSLTQQKQLWEMAENDKILVKDEHEKLFHEAATWRAVIIPGNSIKAANFIWWCFKNKLFATMMQSQSEAYKTDAHADEVSPEGVKQFWRQVTNYLTEVGL